MLIPLFLVLMLSPVALAQSPDVVYNLPSWGTSLLTFALALTLFTEAIKTRLKNRLETVPSYIIQGTTFALGIGIAALIHSQGLLIDPLFSQLPAPFNWLLYGGLAGLGAVGGYDLLKSLLGLVGGNTQLPTPAPTAAQAEAQVSAVPKLALQGLRALAASFGIPAFVTETILNENTFEEAERIIREMGKRAPTPDEVRDRVTTKAQEVITTPATPP